MAKKSDYSLFINFFNSLKKGLFINFKALIIHFSLFFCSLFTIHYKKGPLFTNHYTPSRPSSMLKAEYILVFVNSFINGYVWFVSAHLSTNRSKMSFCDLCSLHLGGVGPAYGYAFSLNSFSWTIGQNSKLFHTNFLNIWYSFYQNCTIVPFHWTQWPP